MVIQCKIGKSIKNTKEQINIETLREIRGLLCWTTFTITNEITAVYWLNEIFFSNNFKREPTQLHMVFPPVEDIIKM